MGRRRVTVDREEVAQTLAESLVVCGAGIEEEPDETGKHLDRKQTDQTPAGRNVEKAPTFSSVTIPESISLAIPSHAVAWTSGEDSS